MIRSLSLALCALFCLIGLCVDGQAQDSLIVTVVQDTSYIAGDTVVTYAYDSVYSGDTLDFFGSMERAVLGLDTSLMPGRIMFDKGGLSLKWTNSLIGGNPELYGTPIGWVGLYGALSHSHVSGSSFLSDYDSLFARASAYDSLNTSLLSLVIVDGFYMDTLALEDSLLAINGHQLVDVGGRPRSPWIPAPIYYASILNNAAVAGDTVYFVLDSLSTLTNIKDSIAGIAIRVDSNSSWVQLQEGVQTPMVFDSSGAQTVEIRLAFNSSVRDTVFVYAQTYVEADSTGSSSTNMDGKSSQVASVTTLGTPDEVHTVTATRTYEGAAASGEYHVWYGCGNSSITRPFIFVSGIDPFGSYDIGAITGKYNNFFDSLVANGYDVIVVDYDEGADYIQRNAFMLEEVISEVVNAIGANDSLVVMGESMGGVVARYALADMEDRSEEHRTRLYVSYDAPHQGAYIPQGILSLYPFVRQYNEAGQLTLEVLIAAIIFGAILGIAAVIILLPLLAVIGLFSPALAGFIAKFLIGLGIFSTVSTAAYIDFVVLEEFRNDLRSGLQLGPDDEITATAIIDRHPAVAQLLYFVFDDNADIGYTSRNPYRTQFLSDLNNIGYPNPSNDPTGVVKVAIPNGDIYGRTQSTNAQVANGNFDHLDPVNKMTTWSGVGTGSGELVTLDVDGNILFDLNIKVWSTTSGGNVSRISMIEKYVFPIFYYKRWVNRQSDYSLAGVPGGFYGFDTNDYNMWEEGGVHRATLNYQASAFMPTVSTVDLDVEEWNVNVSQVLASSPGSTPFDYIYHNPGTSNTFHNWDDVAREGADFFPGALELLAFDHLYSRFDEFVQCYSTSSGENFVHRARFALTAGENVKPTTFYPQSSVCPVVVSAGSTGLFEAGTVVSLEPGFTAEAGSEFCARIDPTIATSCVASSVPVVPSISSDEPIVAGERGSQWSPSTPQYYSIRRTNIPLEQYDVDICDTVVEMVDEALGATASVSDDSDVIPVCARINVYPNPVSRLMNVYVSTGRYDLASISVNAMNGKAIFGTDLNVALFDRPYEGVFDLSELAQGTYLVIVRFDDGSTCSTRIVVQ